MSTLVCVCHALFNNKYKKVTCKKYCYLELSDNHTCDKLIVIEYTCVHVSQRPKNIETTLNKCNITTLISSWWTIRFCKWNQRLTTTIISTSDNNVVPTNISTSFLRQVTTLPQPKLLPVFQLPFNVGCKHCFNQNLHLYF